MEYSKMSKLKEDKERDIKLQSLIMRLVTAHQNRTEGKLDLSKPEFQKNEVDLVVKNSIDINFIDGYNELSKSLLEFDEGFSDFLNLAPLASSNERTLQEHSEELRTLLKLFLDDLSAQKKGYRYEIKFNKASARHRWQEWRKTRPLIMSLKDMHNIDINQGIVEKYVNKSLSPQHWLTQPDIERYLDATQKRGDIHVTTFEAANIGSILHFEREKHVNDINPYKIPFMINLGTNGLVGQGSHWVRMIVTVNPQTKTISVKYTDTLKINDIKKIEKALSEAIKYTELFEENNAPKTYQAFPDYQLEIKPEDIIGTGEQQDSWACGYRALQGLYIDLQYEGDIKTLEDKNKLADHVTETILINAHLDIPEGSLPQNLTVAPTSAATPTIRTLEKESIKNELIKLRNKNQTTMSAQDLAEIEKSVTAFMSHPEIQSFKTANIDPIDIDLKKLFTQLNPKDEIAKKAIIRCILNSLKLNKNVNKIQINGMNEITADVADFMVNELDQVATFKDFTCDGSEEIKNKMEMTAKRIAARNQMLSEYKINVLEEQQDWWTIALEYNLETVSEAALMLTNDIQYFKNGNKGTLQMNNNERILQIGPLWFEKYLKFIQEQRGILSHIWPKELTFDMNTRSGTLTRHFLENNMYINEDYIDVLIKHLSQKDYYFPFTTLKLSGLDFNKKSLTKIQEFLQLPQINDLQAVSFSNLAENQLDTDTLCNLLEGILQIIKSKKIRTSISFTNFNVKDVVEKNKVVALADAITNECDKNMRIYNQDKIKAKISDSAAKQTQPSITATLKEKTPHAVTKVGVVKLRACKKDPNTSLQSLQVEHLYQAQQQQQVQQQIQQQQQQLIQAQQLRQKEEVAAGDQFLSTNSPLVDRNNIQSNIALRELFESMELSNKSSLSAMWDNLVGVGAEEIGVKIKATEEAVSEIIKHEQHFKYGFNKDNLPRRFFIQRSGEYEVLCYNKFKFIENKNESPLTVKLYDKPIITISTASLLKEFHLPDVPGDSKPLDVKKAWYYRLMDKEDSQNAQHIQQFYSDIIDNFSGANFEAFAHVIKRSGCIGVEYLFLQFRELEKLNQGEYFKIFKSSFLDSSSNWMEFLNEQSLTTLSKITKLSDDRLAWWSTLSSQHITACGWADINDLFEAFTYFCEKLEQFKPPLSLPPMCKLTNVANMKIAMDRMLTILNNAVNPQEQLYYINGITLHPTGAYIASRYHGYNLVTQEMHFDPEITQEDFAAALGFQVIGEITPEMSKIMGELTQGAKSTKQSSLIGPESEQVKVTISYSADYKKLNNLALETSVDIDRISRVKKQFFRYIGLQSYRSTFDRYVALAQLLEQETKLNDNLKCKLFALFTFTTTGQDVYLDNFVSAAQIFIKNIVDTLDTVTPQKADAVLSGMLDWNDIKPGISVSTLAVAYTALCEADIAQLKTITTGMRRQFGIVRTSPTAPATTAPAIKPTSEATPVSAPAPIAPIVINDFKSFLDGSKGFGSHFATSLKLYQQNKARLSLEQYNHCQKQIKASTLDISLQKKLSILVAMINRDTFQLDHINSLITEVDRLSKIEAKTAHQLLDIFISIDLSKIDPLQANPLPKLEEIRQLIAIIQTSQTYNDLFQLITSRYSGCVFNTAAISSGENVDYQKLLEQNMSSIIDLATQFPFLDIDIAKLKGADGVKYLLDSIKAHEDNIALTPLIIKAKKLLRDQHKNSLKNQLRQKSIEPTGTLELLLFERLDSEVFSQDATLEILMQNLANREKTFTDFISALSVIKAKYPTHFQQVVDDFTNAKGISLYAVKELTDILITIPKHYVDKPFPLKLLKELLNHPQLIAKNITLQHQQLLTAILKKLMSDNKFNGEQKQQILTLILNLIPTGIDIEQYYLTIEQYAEQHGEEFSFILKILQAAENLKTTTESLNSILASVDKKAKKQFLEVISTHPSDINIIIEKAKIRAKTSPLVLKIIGFAWLEAHYAALQLAEKDKKTAAEIALIKENSFTLLANLNKYLDTLDEKGKQNIADLYDAHPQPTLNKLKELWEQNKPLEQFIIDFEKDPTGERTVDDAEQRIQVINKQFDTTRVVPVIESIMNLGYAKPHGILYSQKQQLQNQFMCVNAIGHNRKIRINPETEPAIFQTVKDMSRKEITNLVIHCRKLLHDPNASSEQKVAARLNFLALIREVMYRTTGRMPFSTQIMSVLNAMIQGGNMMSQINTGEGKGLITALFAAMQWVEGQTVDVCTSNMELAQRDLQENASFFNYLGISTGLIFAGSNDKAYKIDGINYSDVAQLSLFQSRLKIEQIPLPEHRSLVLDEGDFTILDDSTQYRYAINLDASPDPYKNIYEDIYDLLNDFIETDIFNDKNMSITDDIRNAREYLYDKAKDKVNLIKSISDTQLDTWLDSAYAAKMLHKKGSEVFANVTETREIFDETKQIRMARLRIHNRISSNAQWSNGVQQFLHARLNKEFNLTKASVRYPIDPEKAAVSSISSKNFIDQYRQSGVVQAMTGTPGSEKEREEQRLKFGFKINKIPPHKKSKRVDRLPIIARDNEERKQKVLDEIKEHLRQSHRRFWQRDGRPQPILIICKDVASSKAMHEFLARELRGVIAENKLQLYNGDPEDATQKDLKEADVVSKAGVSGMITISTPMFGRGTDFKPRFNEQDKDQNHPDGLFVMQPYIETERSEGQVFGRAGRQGWAGETLLIASQEELMEISDEKLREAQFPAAKQALREQRSKIELGKREARERLSDIRNHVFEKFLWLLEEIKTEEKMFGKAGADAIKKTLLKEWEYYLNNLDKKWNELLQENKDNLQKCAEAVAEYAVNQWQGKIVKTFENALQAQTFKLKDETKNALDLTVAKVLEISHTEAPELPPAVIPYKQISEEIDIDKICYTINPDIRKDIDETHKNSPVLASAISNALNLFISKISRNSKLTAKITGDTNEEKYKQAVGVILDEYIKSFGKKNQDMYRMQLRRYFQELADIARWSGVQVRNEFKAAFDENLNGLLQSPDIRTENQLQRRMVDILSLENNGLIENNYLDNWKTKNQKELCAKTKAAALNSIDEYLNGWFLARDRRTIAETLRENIEQIKTVKDGKSTYQQLIELLNQSRNEALINDRNADDKAFLFKRNKSGSRFQDMLDNVRKIAIATNDSTLLTKQQPMESDDIKNLLENFRQRLSNNQTLLNNAVNKCLKSLDTGNLQESLKACMTLMDNLALPAATREINRDSSLEYLIALMNRRTQQLALYMEQNSPQVRKSINEQLIWKRMANQALEQEIRANVKPIIPLHFYPSTKGLEIPAAIKSKLQPKPGEMTESSRYFERIWYNLPGILSQLEYQIIMNLGENTIVKFDTPKISQKDENSTAFTLSIKLTIQTADQMKKDINIDFQIDPAKQVALCDWPTLGVSEIAIPSKTTKVAKPKLGFFKAEQEAVAAKPAEENEITKLDELIAEENAKLEALKAQRAALKNGRPKH